MKKSKIVFVALDTSNVKKVKKIIQDQKLVAIKSFLSLAINFFTAKMEENF